jgi:hypothetical protein
MEALQGEIERLIKDGFYDSAEILVRLFRAGIP